MTQFEARKKLRIKDPNLLSLYENGQCVPTPENARKIEELFGVPANLWPSESDEVEAQAAIA